MSNQTEKPKQTAAQLIEKMKSKGITFHYISEQKAADFLSGHNNYMRTASYRKNYQKYPKGPNTGKYMNLDFSYLQELSVIDMHFRFLISKMCSDIEHDLKVRMLREIELDSTTDGYDIVTGFLGSNAYILGKLEGTSASPFTCDLIQKYFTVVSIQNPLKRRPQNKITDYRQCPAWVLLELLTFGDFIKFYEYYNQSRSIRTGIPVPVIHLVKSMRNGAAHNNCILANLDHGSSRAPGVIERAVQNFPSISKSQRQKKLSCRPMLEFVALLYTYDLTVSEKVKFHRIQELRELFFHRMVEKKAFFEHNDLIRTNYEFACKIISGFFNS